MLFYSFTPKNFAKLLSSEKKKTLNNNSYWNEIKKKFSGFHKELT